MSTLKNYRLLSLKNQMSRAYDLEDWQGLADLDKQCQETVGQIIEDDPRAMFDELREILGFYAELIASCEVQRNQYAREAKQLRLGRHHRDTYADLDKLSAVSP
ncbi:MAG: flagellar protein FliT [Pseudomonadales bacterium]|nr:flagellar protein FliT [Pseudomonadales bacterium]